MFKIIAVSIVAAGLVLAPTAVWADDDPTPEPTDTTTPVDVVTYPYQDPSAPKSEKDEIPADLTLDCSRGGWGYIVAVSYSILRVTGPNSGAYDDYIFDHDEFRLDHPATECEQASDDPPDPTPIVVMESAVIHRAAHLAHIPDIR